MTRGGEAPGGIPTTAEVGVWGGCTKDGAGPMSLALSIETSCKGPYCTKGQFAQGIHGNCGPVEGLGVTGVTWGGTSQNFRDQGC